MIEIKMFSRNTLLIEGFRSIVAGHLDAAFVSSASFKGSAGPLHEHGKIVVVDSQLIHDGALRYLQQLPDQLPQAMVVSNSIEMNRLAPLLPSHVQLLQADRDAGSILAVLFKLLDRVPGLKAQRRETRNLTQRETQVLRHVAEGHSNKEIAASRGISVETVKFHVASAMKKLGVYNRTAAAIEAVRLGLVEIKFTPPEALISTRSNGVRAA